MTPAFAKFSAYRRFNHHSTLCFSPGGDQILCCHDGGGRFAYWRQLVSGPEECVATFETGASGPAVWSSSGIVVAVDGGGDERWQLHRLDPATGACRLLTDRPQVEHQIHPCSLFEPGARLLLGANRRQPSDVGIHLLDIKQRTIVPVLEDQGVFSPGPWHPSGRAALVIQHHHNSDQDLHLLQLADGSRRCLSSHVNAEQNRPVGFDRDGHTALLVTDRGWEHTWIAARSLDGGAERVLWRGEWPVDDAVVSSDRRIMAWCVNIDGRSRLYAMALATGSSRALTGLPEGEVEQLAIAPNGARLACLLATPTRAAELYLVEIRTGEVTKLTDGFLGGISEEAMVRPEPVRYRTFDGRLISGWLYRPHGAARRVGAVMLIHGGPEAQERGSYNPVCQFLAAHGVAVLAPNIRGSTGYGTTFQRLIYRDWGGGELRDIEAGAGYLRFLPWVDPTRLGICGVSFGGFVTLSAMTRLPDLWSVGVAVNAPSDLVTLIDGFPPTWRPLAADLIGDSDQDAEMLRARSPITHVDGLRAPLLLLQGANDARVNRGQADRFVAAARERGHRVDYRLIEEEGHVVSQRRTHDATRQLMCEFLLRHLV